MVILTIVAFTASSVATAIVNRKLSIVNEQRLYCYGLESLLSIGFTADLLARLKGQWLGELNRNSPEKPVYIFDPADISRTREVGHIEAVALAKTWNAETRRYLLTRIWTLLITIARERRPSARNIHHLTLQKYFAKVLGKPDRPVITKSLFPSSFSICLHSKLSVPF